MSVVDVEVVCPLKIRTSVVDVEVGRYVVDAEVVCPLKILISVVDAEVVCPFKILISVVDVEVGRYYSLKNIWRCVPQVCGSGVCLHLLKGGKIIF
jgi:hypothetical protein